MNRTDSRSVGRSQGNYDLITNYRNFLSSEVESNSKANKEWICIDLHTTRYIKLTSDVELNGVRLPNAVDAVGYATFDERTIVASHRSQRQNVGKVNA